MNVWLIFVLIRMIYDLADELNLPPDGFICSDGTKAFSIDVLCLFL